MKGVYMIYYICDRSGKNKSLGGHCLEHCRHGKPHKVERCSTDTECHIDCGRKIKNEDIYVHNGWETCKKSIMVRCRPANKEELLRYTD